MPDFPDIQAKDFEGFKHEFIIRLRHYLKNLRSENIISVDPDLITASLDATLQALALLDAAAGILVQTAADSFTKRSLAAGSSKVSIVNPAGTAGNPTIDIVPGNIDHNDLDNIDGGGATEKYHFTLAQYNNLKQASDATHAGYLTSAKFNDFDAKLAPNGINGAFVIGAVTYTITNGQITSIV